MNALLSHRWGLSRAQDRVWAQVTGLRSSRAIARPLMVFQAFMDESVTDGATFVLAGYIATAEKWARFTKDWEELLPYGTLASDGSHHFKMKEMASLPERMERVRAFYKVIESHDLIGLSCKIDVSELARAKARVWVSGLAIDWGFINNGSCA